MTRTASRQTASAHPISVAATVRSRDEFSNGNEFDTVVRSSATPPSDLTVAATLNRAASAIALSLLLAGTLPVHSAAKVVIITPHVDAIRHEFARGFAEWHQQQFEEPAEVEWRNVGGTSDALRFILSEYTKKPDGIGLDILFGGGLEPYYVLADKKLTAAYRPPPNIFDGLPRTLGGMEIHDANFHWF